MFGRVSVIALNTYREAVRARILLGLAGVAFAVSLYSLVVGAFTLNDAPRVVSDLGSATMSIFAIAVAVLMSATSLHRELEQKTIFPILARPIRRGEYLAGKYLGTLLTLAVFLLADCGVVLLLVATLGGRSSGLVAAVAAVEALVFLATAAKSAWVRTFGPIPLALALAVGGALLAGVAPAERQVVLAGALLSFGEVAIVAAVATLFASFSTPFLSALLTLGVWLVGRSADSLARLPAKYVTLPVKQIGAVVARFWPNLQVYVPPRPLLAGEAPGVDLRVYLALAGVRALCWAVLLLAIAGAVFRRRDFL